MEITIKQTCFYKVKVSDDDIKKDRVLEGINTHPLALIDNAEMFDINTMIVQEGGEWWVILNLHKKMLNI